MKAIAVDDEIYMLETLLEAVSASSDIEAVDALSSCSAALAHATEHPVDIAFLDINMRGIGGLGLAEKLLALQPGCKIVFCTGHEEYAVSAFQLHVSGYLIKPITAESISSPGAMIGMPGGYAITDSADILPSASARSMSSASHDVAFAIVITAVGMGIFENSHFSTLC